MTRVRFSAAALLLASSPLAAGVYYEATTKTTTEGRQTGDAYTVRAWVEGDRAKVLFDESANPMMAQGSYLVTNDGGATVYLVNTEDQTYAAFDLEKMLSVVGDLDEMTGGAVSMDFADGSSEVLSRGPGEAVLGRPTTRLEWKAAFTMKMKILGMSRENRIETVTEAWLSDQLGDQGFGIWLRKGPPKTGDADLDAALAAGWQDFDGFPLKSVTRTVNTGEKGKSRTSISTTEVSVLREEAAPAGAFEIPAGFTEVSLMPTVADEEEPTNPLKGLFGRKGKKKDGS